MTDLLVVGGGAAGLAAAACAEQLGDSVMILERMDRVGKKLLATGNGRCNLMNLGAPVYPQGSAFALQVLQQMPAERQICFWRSLGLFLREEAEGRVYPCTGQASTVLDVLRFSIHGPIHVNTPVTEIRKTKDGWQAVSGKDVYSARRILLAGGGEAQKSLGSDGSCVELLRKRGYPTSPLRPALTQLKTDKAVIRGLEGIRVRAGVRVLVNGRCVHEEHGEVLFAAYGLSGVCILQCAAYADQDGTEISLDLTEGLGLTADELKEELSQRNLRHPSDPPERLLTGILLPRVAQAVLRQALSEPVSGRLLKQKEIERIAKVVSDFRIQVNGLNGLDKAQVTRGGVDPGCFKCTTMESLQEPGLFAAGEMLDVDGDCGGFNLMFAVACGLLAAKNGRKAPWEEKA